MAQAEDTVRPQAQNGRASQEFQETGKKFRSADNDDCCILEELKHLEKERKTFKAVLACMGQGLIVIDTGHTVVYCNREAEELLGLSAGELVGRPLEPSSPRFEDSAAGSGDWRDLLTTLITGGLTSPARAILRLPSAREVQATAFSVVNGSRLGAGALLCDVTQERETERMKAELMSLASHQLRTPMTSIMGFSELLLRSRSLSSDEQTMAEWLHKESRRLNAIVEQLLNVSRIETGKLVLALRPLAIEPLLVDTLSMLKTRYRRHFFRVEISPDFPEVLADPGKLTQIFYNVIDNGGKYSPAGTEIVVSATVDETRRQGVLAVSDQGPGIPSADLPYVFKRFFRAGHGAQAIQGTGLGLYIARSLLEMMKGTIWVESKEHEGSTFFISLPLAGESRMKDKRLKIEENRIGEPS